MRVGASLAFIGQAAARLEELKPARQRERLKEMMAELAPPVDARERQTQAALEALVDTPFCQDWETLDKTLHAWSKTPPSLHPVEQARTALASTTTIMTGQEYLGRLTSVEGLSFHTRLAVEVARDAEALDRHIELVHLINSDGGPSQQPLLQQLGRLENTTGKVDEEVRGLVVSKGLGLVEKAYRKQFEEGEAPPTFGRGEIDEDPSAAIKKWEAFLRRQNLRIEVRELDAGASGGAEIVFVEDALQVGDFELPTF